MRTKGSFSRFVPLWLCGILILGQQLLAADIATASSTNAPTFAGVQPTKGGEVLLKVRSATSVRTDIQVSTNLQNWSTVATLPGSATVQDHTDATQANAPYRFYRVLSAATNAITGDHIATSDGDLVIHPVDHASFVMTWKDQAIYVDPVGSTSLYNGLPKPTMVFVTDIHGDHLSSTTLNSIGATNGTVFAPREVFNQLSSGLRAKTTVLTNGATATLNGITIEAIPMYNITPGRTGHTKGRGNGYVLNIGGKRVYISGDTEDIPEMRALKGIDVAFICMNIPFTMDINQASSAVREFRPKVVYPYHSRGSDVQKFKELVGSDQGVEVRLRKWY